MAKITMLMKIVGKASLCLLVCSWATAQAPGPNDGILLFSTHEWGIDLAHSAIHLSFPLRSKAGKIPYSSSVEETNYYSVVVNNGTPYWALWPDPFYGPSFVDTVRQASLSGTLSAQKCNTTPPIYYYDTYTVTSITDATGASHPLQHQVAWIRNNNSQVCINHQQTNPVSAGVTDNSGYTLYVNTTGSPIVYDKTGYAYTVPVPFDSFVSNSQKFSELASTVTDPDGATISGGFSISGRLGGAITDTLNTTALTLTGGGTGGGALKTASYTDPSGNAQQQYTMLYTSLSLRTNFGCSPRVENSGSYSLPTSIQIPSGGSYTVSYEPTPGYSGYYTGRVHQITFPSGGSISYTYSDSTGHNGMDCSNQLFPFVPTITVTVNDNNGNSNIYTYVHSVPAFNSSSFTVTKTDPALNQTVYTFYGEFQTQVQYYQGSATGTPLKTVLTCYNGNTTNCANPSSVTLPITQTDAYSSLGTSTSNHMRTTYDSIGNVTSELRYDYGASTPTLQTFSFYGQSWNGSSCTAYTSGTYINNTSCYIHSTNSSGVDIAKTQTTYNNAGHATTTEKWTSGSSWLTSSSVYGTNGASPGVLSSSTDVSGATTSYSNFACNGMLAQTTTLPLISGESTQMSTSKAWNCNGGALTSSTDANGQVTQYGYVNEQGAADPFWRRLSVTDPLGNVTWTDYSPSGTLPQMVETYLNYPSTNPTSTQDTLRTLDGLSRVIKSQTRTAPGSGTFDNTVVYTYGWQSGSGACTSQPPFTTGACTTQTIPGGSAVTTTQEDALRRTLSVTDGGGGTVSHSYNQNDDLAVVGPAPSGESNKQVQKEYDGLGRLTNSCAIGNGSTTACGQSTGSANGVTTSFSYTYPASGTQISVVTSTRGVQSRTTAYDGLGRVTQVVTPEGKTWNYFYDSYSSCPSGFQGMSGQLAAVKDPNNNLICYQYDSLNRVKGTNANGTSCRGFLYDAAGTIPIGVTAPTYALDRMIEAYTYNCSTTLITDEWFSYDKDGRMTDMWQMTPHSGQYYHSIATFQGNDTTNIITSLQLSSPALYTMTYTLDGEGRWNTLTDTTTNQEIVSGPTAPGAMYDAAGRVLNVKLTGTTPDQDIYTYDPNTGRMKTFEFEVGNTPKNITGTLTWNTNGTLAEVQIVDGFYSGGTETCYSNSSALPLHYGYDDWGRLVEFDCGTGKWGQQYSYDVYDNLAKTVISGRTGTTWNPGYSPTTNGCNGCTYDSNGDVTGDGSAVYGWDEFSKLKWTASSGSPTCGSSGRCLVYDAFGRPVEQSNGSTWTERWITQLGETAYMNGATATYAYWPAPGDGKALIHGNSSSYEYLHPDWLGNARITSNIGTNTVVADQSYTPYGEVYNVFGSGGSEDRVFATLMGDFAPGTTTPTMWDTPNRELSYVGRWLSPDPAGMGAVDTSDPQNWNRYAYVTYNPLSATDPLGLNPQCNEADYANCLNMLRNAAMVANCRGAGEAGLIMNASTADACQTFFDDLNICIYAGPSNCDAWHDLFGAGSPLAATIVDKPKGLKCSDLGVICYGDDQHILRGDYDGERVCARSGCFVWHGDGFGNGKWEFVDPVDDRVNQLAQEINKTGVQTIRNPCFAGGFYAGSAMLGAPAVLGPAAVDFVLENPATVIDTVTRWMYPFGPRPSNLTVGFMAARRAAEAIHSFCTANIRW